MSKGYEYMRQVTVQSVGVNGIVDDNGRSLRVIGNMPIKPGDTVWTDGRIVYGHRPVRPSVKPLSDEKIMYPYSGESGCGAIFASGQEADSVHNIEPMHSSGSNWMYVDEKGTIYTYMMGADNPAEQFIDSDDSSFYLDMRVTDSAVFTAEIDVSLPSFYGESVSTDRFHFLGFQVRNMYLHEVEGYTPENPSFGVHWPNNGAQQVTTNNRIRVRRNGVETALISLNSFDKVVETFKELYVSYDTLDDSIEKRYHWSGYVDTEMTIDENIDINVSLWTVQPLNFRFTDDNGAWEMTYCTVGQGSIAPHTVDQEKNDDGEWEDVQSWFCILIPLVYYVVRVDSRGNETILQRWIRVTKYQNNLVKKSAWTNAKKHPVQRVNIEERPGLTFTFDGGYITVTNNFSAVTGVYDKQGGKVGDINYHLFTFDFLTVPDPDATSTTYGATNRAKVFSLLDGTSYTIDADNVMPWIPFTSGDNMWYYGIILDTEIKRAYFTQYGSSYLGRVSIQEIDDGYLLAIFGQLFYYFPRDGDWYGVGRYCRNFNIKPIRRRKKFKTLKTIRDLIASRTEARGG